MLGVVENPVRTPSDEVMEKVATDMGVADTFHPTPVGVFFGGPGQPAGEEVRRPVLRRRRAGAQHLPQLRRVHERLPAQRQEHAGQELPLPRRAERRHGAAAHHGHPDLAAGGRRLRRPGEVHEGQDQPRPAGAHRRARRDGRGVAGHPEAAAPDEGRGPPASRSPTRLGYLSRTNSESILGAIAPGHGPDRLHPTASRSPRRSTPTPTPTSSRCATARASTRWRMLQTVLTDGDGDGPRWRMWLKEMWTPARQHQGPLRLQALVRAHRDRAGDAEPRQLDHDLRQARAVHAAVADDVASRATAPRTRPGSRSPTRRYAGWPRRWAAPPAATSASRSGLPLTAHFIGGCAIGDSPETGVVDPYQRVYGHPGLHVADGAAVTANLGVNPSLTITAQAERAMAFWPNKGEADPRPALGEQYARCSRWPRLPGRPGLGARGAAAADRRGQLSRGCQVVQVRHRGVSVVQTGPISAPDRASTGVTRCRSR